MEGGSADAGLCDGTGLPKSGASLGPLYSQENVRRKTSDRGAGTAACTAQPAYGKTAGFEHLQDAFLHTVVSPLPKGFFRQFIVGMDHVIEEKRASYSAEDPCDASNACQTLVKTRATGGRSEQISSVADSHDEAKDASTGTARATSPDLSTSHSETAEIHRYGVRLPYSDRLIALQTCASRSSEKRSSLKRRQVSTSSGLLSEVANPQNCSSFFRWKLGQIKRRHEPPESHIRGQLLREIGSRIKLMLNLAEDPFSPLAVTKKSSSENSEQAKLSLQANAEVQALTTLYARLLLFDQLILLSHSQWWRFQGCEDVDEHACQQPTVKPFFSLMHVVPKLRKASCLRPSVSASSVIPHVKVTIDLMHVCLTAHYLFGQEDRLAQELLRIYEVYCFLNNTRSGEQLTLRLRSVIQYTEEIRQKLGFPSVPVLLTLSRGDPVTPSMEKELSQAESYIRELKYKHPQHWKDWVQHLQRRRQLRLQRDGEALLFKQCEAELEEKWLQILKLRQAQGYTQSNLEMKVALIHTDAEEDRNTIQLEILAEAEELFYYHLDQHGENVSVLAPNSSSPAGDAHLQHGSKAPRRGWRFNLPELIEAISFKFEMQGRRQPGQPLRRLLLTQAPHSHLASQVIPLEEQVRRVLATSLHSSVACKINDRALSRRAHIPLNFPSFASSSRHVIPSWNLSCSTAAKASVAGATPAEPGEHAEHTFGTLLTEPLSQICFDVELHHAGLDSPRRAKAHVPVAPKLSSLTEALPLSNDQKTKDILSSSLVDPKPPPLPWGPLTFYVDVPFSSDDAEAISRHSPPERLDARSSNPSYGPYTRTEDEPGQQTAGEQSPSHSVAGEGVADRTMAASNPVSISNDELARRREDGNSSVSQSSEQSLRHHFLMKQTELRLNAENWDQEEAAEAEALARSAAVALAAESEAKAFMKAALETAAAETKRDMENAKGDEVYGRRGPKHLNMHGLRAFGLQGRQGGQFGSISMKHTDFAESHVPTVGGGGGAGDHADQMSPSRECQRAKNHSRSKKSSIVEEERNEVEQEATLIARASIVAAAHGAPGSLDLFTRRLVEYERGDVTPSEKSPGATDDRHTITPDRNRRRRPVNKAGGDPSPTAHGQDSAVAEIVAPIFTTDENHGLAYEEVHPDAKERISRSFVSSLTVERGQDAHRGETRVPAFMNDTISKAVASSCLCVEQNQGFSAHSTPHILTYSLSGTLLPPPRVIVPRAGRALEAINCCPARGSPATERAPGASKTPYRQQNEKSSRFQSPSPPSDLPPSPAVDMKASPSMLQRARNGAYNLVELVPFHGAHQSSAPSGWPPPPQYFAESCRRQSLSKGGRLEEEVSFYRAAQDSTSPNVPNSRLGRPQVHPGKPENDVDAFALSSKEEGGRCSESFRGCLKLKITLAPAPLDSGTEALLEGLEACIVQRHTLQSKINADSALTTLIRRLPSSPADFRESQYLESAQYASFSAAVAAGANEPAEAAYSSCTRWPSSPRVSADSLSPRKRAAHIRETLLLRSRPLSQCVRLTLLLRVGRDSCGTVTGGWTSSLRGSVALVDDTCAKEVGLQWQGTVPSLDSESWWVLQQLQRENARRVDTEVTPSPGIPAGEDVAAEEDEDEGDGMSSKEKQEDLYVATLRSAMLAAMPKQAAVVLTCPESPPFSAIVREVVPRIDARLLLRQLSLRCCFKHLIGFSKYVESQGARRRTTLIETEDKSLGIFLKVRRLYNVPAREEPRSLEQWHYRHELINKGSPHTPSKLRAFDLHPDGFSFHDRPVEGCFAHTHGIRSPPSTVRPEEYKLSTNATQLSNAVVELKYANRNKGIEISAVTKAVSGENPVINQLIHLQLPSGTEGEVSSFDELLTQDSSLTLNVFDQPPTRNAACAPCRRFLGKVTIPWSIILDGGSSKILDTEMWGGGGGGRDKSVKLPVTRSRKTGRGICSKIEDAQNSSTVCIMRGCVRAEQPPVLVGYRRPTLPCSVSCVKGRNGRGDALRSNAGGGSREQDGADDPLQLNSRPALSRCNSSTSRRNTIQNFGDRQEDPEVLCMYIRFSLYMRGTSLCAAREAVARAKKGRTADLWGQMHSAGEKRASDTLQAPSSSPDQRSATARAPLPTAVTNGTPAACNQQLELEGGALVALEEKWTNQCERKGMMSPCSAFGLDMSGGLMLLCRLVAPLLPPPEVATPGSFRCFERAAAFVSLFPSVDDRLLFGLHGKDKVWLNPQEQVQVACGEGRGQALLLCCFFAAFDLLLQTRCSNYLARARVSGKGLQYLVLRQSVDGSVQLWDPGEPRCVFLPSPASKYRDNKTHKESVLVPDCLELHTCPQPSTVGLTLLQRQRLLQFRAIEQQRLASSTSFGYAANDGTSGKGDAAFNTGQIPATTSSNVPAGQLSNSPFINDGTSNKGDAAFSIGHIPATTSSNVSPYQVSHSPFICGGVTRSDEKGVMPVESLDIVFNDENVFANLQGLTCSSSCSDEVLLQRGGGESWEPLTAGTSMPESERNLREKIRKKLLRHRRRRCCGLIYAFSQLRKHLKRMFTRQFCLRATASFLSFVFCDRRLRPPPKFPTIFELSFDFEDKKKWCALLPSLRELPFLSDPEAVLTAATQFQESLCSGEDLSSAAQAAATSVGVVGSKGLLRISLFPPVGLITSVTAALRYQPADANRAKELEGQLQSYLEARIRRFVRWKQRIKPVSTEQLFSGTVVNKGQEPKGTGGQCGPATSQTQNRPSKGNKGSSSPSLPSGAAVFFARHITDDVYELLEHFEAARSCMSWQQPVRAHELGSVRGAHDAAGCPPINTSTYSAVEIEAMLRECLIRHHLIDEDGGSTYALPIHFSRMDTYYVWQLVENTRILEPCLMPSAANDVDANHRWSPRGAHLREGYTNGCGPATLKAVTTPIFALVVRVFPYPCGVYSGWLFISRLA